MHYTDRWILSQTIATAALFVLMAIIGIPRHLWLDLLHMWFVTMAVNNIRLTLTRNRKVGEIAPDAPGRVIRHIGTAGADKTPLGAPGGLGGLIWPFACASELAKRLKATRTRSKQKLV